MVRSLPSSPPGEESLPAECNRMQRPSYSEFHISQAALLNPVVRMLGVIGSYPQWFSPTRLFISAEEKVDSAPWECLPRSKLHNVGRFASAWSKCNARHSGLIPGRFATLNEEVCTMTNDDKRRRTELALSSSTERPFCLIRSPGFQPTHSFWSTGPLLSYIRPGCFAVVVFVCLFCVWFGFCWWFFAFATWLSLD